MPAYADVPGARLAYRSWGDGSRPGPPALWLHGGSGDGNTWAPIAGWPPVHSYPPDLRGAAATGAAPDGPAAPAGADRIRLGGPAGDPGQRQRPGSGLVGRSAPDHDADVAERGRFEQPPGSGALRRMGEEIPGCRFVTVEGGGHGVHGARPAEFVAAVATFLATL